VKLTSNVSGNAISQTLRMLGNEWKHFKKTLLLNLHATPLKQGDMKNY
jgi:hypothetical protein